MQATALPDRVKPRLIKLVDHVPVLSLPPIPTMIDTGASHAETRAGGMGGYERALRAACTKLINGVMAKGRQAPHLPLETTDPAEFAQLELRNLDAVDPRTGKTVWYGVLIGARELSEGSSPAP